MEVYLSLKETHQNQVKKLKNTLNTLSFFRFLSIILALFLGYLYYQSENYGFLFLSVTATILFLILLRYYDKIAQLKSHKQAIININVDEFAYLHNEKIPFQDGLEFNNTLHEYAYDLDIFGNRSLFQNLNRTYTYIGKKTLANTLLTQLSNQEIVDNQEAIKELAEKINWRQDFMGFAKLAHDKELFYKQLLSWSTFNSKQISKIALVFMYFLPVVFAVLLLIYYFFNSNILPFLILSFIGNLVFALQFFKRIKIENEQSTNIDKIVKQYSLMIESIEIENFKAKKLVQLKNDLHVNSSKASTSLRQLSRLFSKLDSASNPTAALLLNGVLLYHVHGLKALIHWKTEKAKYLENWLHIIGEFEMLSSLANFSYNNETFAFPTIVDNFDISFKEMSHPLLNKNFRVTNTISFKSETFIILTGSNMSGKSTFLRSLGINMVLASIGSVVCASSATIHPMPILVSMRLSDSLADSESYFYAEIKRLKQIMNTLENKRSFVLLDEILRGTNSDDKRSGTIAVIEKMIAQNAIGAIATHDIEVCLITNNNPKKLVNKCFEAEIINDDLFFDYTLRDGICKNKSATFLMQKIGVI
jgi:DNA mismatch repair ATPase MutS